MADPSDTKASVRVPLRRIGAAELIAADEELRACAVVHALAPPLRERLLAAATPRRFSPASSLFEQGDPGGPGYLVLRGEVRLLGRSASGSAEFGGARKGELVGEPEETQPGRAYTAIATTELDVLELPQAELGAALRDSTALRQHVSELQRTRRAARDEMSEFLGRW